MQIEVKNLLHHAGNGHQIFYYIAHLWRYLTEIFEHIGGVPKTILFDNLKTVMDEPRTAKSKEL